MATQINPDAEANIQVGLIVILAPDCARLPAHPAFYPASP